MRIWEKIENFNSNKPVITIGTFDGLHLGHAEVIKQINNYAKKINGQSVVFTFWPHPKDVINNNEGYKISLLNTLEEKIELFKKFEIDHLIIHKFTKEFSKLDSCAFIQKYLVELLNIDTLVFGYDHHFGHQRNGNFKSIHECAKKYKFNVLKLDEFSLNNSKISSTQIRKYITEGDVSSANKLLGYNYNFTGVVVGGRKIGNKIGFPTANLKIDSENKILPKVGVYCAYIYIRSQKYKGMFNIGTNPTINPLDREIKIEVNIFDFNKEIYSEKIKVEVFSKIRDEKKFDNIEQLVRQLGDDKAVALNIL